jgi:hypothetical protein
VQTTRSPRLLLVLATITVALGATLARPKAAVACGSPVFDVGDLAAASALLVVGSAVTIGADAALTAIDFTRLPTGRRERTFGIIQTAVALPQVGLYGVAALDSFSNGSDNAGTLWLGMTFWAGVLAGRGVYHIYNAGAGAPLEPTERRPPGPPRPREDRPRPRFTPSEISLAPLVLNDGDGASPGAMLSGRF